MIKINKKLENEYKNKIILITGGTGSIGLGIVKKLIPLKPKMIKILTNDENSIFESKKLLGEISQIKYILGDIRDNDRLRLAMRNVNFVFHAAAMKHIDICEQIQRFARKSLRFASNSVQFAKNPCGLQTIPCHLQGNLCDLWKKEM